MINRLELAFDGVKYLEAQELPITIKNTGSDVFEFEFIPKLDDTAICVPWCSVEPHSGVVEPGDFLVLNITVYIDNNSLKTIGRDRKLNVSMLNCLLISCKSVHC